MATSPGTPERRSLDALQLLKYIGSPIAIGTALLFYFGWVRSAAQALAFGVDVSVFEMSTNDLVLRSISVLFFPLIALLLAGLLFLRLDPWLRANAHLVAPVVRHAWVLLLVGLGLLALNEPVGRALLPVWVLMAAVGMAYGVRLRRRASGDHGPGSTLETLLMGALIVVILFWVTERVAHAGGTGLAYEIKRSLSRESPLALYSTGRLHIDANGVTETQLPGADSIYAYRYDGLYLLQRSGEKYFLLSDGWQHNPPQGRLVVLPDNDSIRLEFGPEP